MNNRISIKIFTIIVFFIFSCSNEIPEDNETFTFVTYDDVTDWDPATAFSLEVVPMSNIYEPLLWYKNSTTSPGLAKSFQKSKSGLEWIFALQEGVFFHDGSVFNADVVKFVIDRNKTFTRGPSYIWSSVDTVKVLNEYTVSILLKEPVPLDLILSSQYGAWMYSPNIKNISLDSLKNGYSSGTGPYYLEKWDKNNAIYLKRFDSYWNRDDKKGYFKRVNLKVVSEASTRLQMIKNNYADFVTLIPSQLIENLGDYLNVDVSYQDSWINHFYLMNTKKEPTNNIWVRRAIASSFDRKVLNEYVYKDLGNIPTGLIPASLPMFYEPDSLVEYSQTKALNFLKKLNINPRDLKVDLSYVSSSEEYRLTALMLYDNLRKIGIDLNMKPGLWSTNWQRAKNIKTAPNIISMAWWPTYPTPSDWFFSLYKTQENPLFNLSYYSNTTVDSLIQSAWSIESSHPEKAALIYKKVQEIIIDDCVVIPATDLNIQSVYNNEIVGFEKNPAYSTLFFYNLKRKN